jgi:hypothetical protein
MKAAMPMPSASWNRAHRAIARAGSRYEIATSLFLTAESRFDVSGDYSTTRDLLLQAMPKRK